MDKEREVFVFNTNTSKFEPCDFEQLRDGDIFYIVDLGERYADPVGKHNVWIAKGAPYLNKDSILTVDTVY